ncbi:hypothetical protein AMS68_007892 [Peltaster fructicola]|uniref:Pre-mRNA splicing factor CLF1 n=1 Tax=Peltaster fructicola TaxID=286661 RepID=A0A6H0Y648_9PEZI|nr:hypothetical protein AMS68_007892 [Peltaster fructicola]
MSVPSPPQALDGHCSTINNGTLYVLSSNSFQSLALQQNATWNSEPTGKAVTGAACAKVTNADPSQSALYVVGGTSDDSSYMGLQRYFFGNKTWETLTPPNDQMRNRLNHSAIYIPDTNNILVYAGNKASDAQWLSSQTFTIVAQAPYVIDGYTALGHTANLPILGQWNSSHAVMTGGTSLDTSVMLFSSSGGWSMYETGLPAPLGTGVKGQLITGADGSKVLQTYDLTMSPNKVSSLLLQGANGGAAAVGTYLGGASKRDLTASNWPSYNSSIAPTITRSDYSFASDGQGLVAFAGGNTDQSVTLFNQTNNGWVDTSRYFYGDQTPLVTSTSASATSSATATATSSATDTSSSAAATSSGSVPDAVVSDAAARQHSMLVLQLGVIIGVIAGLFVLFLLILLFMRYRKRKNAAREGYGEGGRMSFADRGASFMKEAEGSQHNFFPTADRYNNSSRIPPVAPGAVRSSRFSKIRFSRGSKSTSVVNHQPKGSWDSMKELVDKEYGSSKEYGLGKEIEMLPVNRKSPPIIRKPAPTYQSDRAEIANVLGLAPIEADKEQRKRSSGWSRYFATSEPTSEQGMSHLPSAYRKPMPSDGSAYSRAQDSIPQHLAAPAPAMPSHIPASNLMPPLNIDFTKTIDGQRLSAVASSNPSVSNSTENLVKSVPEAQTGRIEESEKFRPVSTATASSYTNRRRTRSSIAASEYFSNQLGAGINGTWTPMTTSFKDHVNDTDGNNSRRTSSMYTNSIYGEPHSRRKSGGATFFPGGGKSKMAYTASPSAEWAQVKDELKHPSLFADSARDSNITVFPEPVGDTYTAVARGPSQKSTKGGSGLSGLTSAANAGGDRASNMTLFPRAVSMKHYPAAARETEIGHPMPAVDADQQLDNDVSWVNLGIGAAK